MKSTTTDLKCDPITLSLFANRFMSVAEAMGRSLQQTSISTNIKERLDYSCALFSHQGNLVANAPFIPVHLGSMSFAVKFQIARLGKDLKPGDVLLANSPVAGGSHLPDLTVITPIFDETPGNEDRIIFFTASRAHHSDIGGITGGSMPATSTCLKEEGAEIVSFKLVSEGKFDAKGLYQVLVEEPARYPGSSGCRNYKDVESDIKAQIAANHKGSKLIHALVEEHGLDTVHGYMQFIQENAEQAVRNMLLAAAQRANSSVFRAVDYLDDGTPISLEVTIDTETGSAVFDFTGTGPEVRGNLNAPMSVVHSAIIYCMRAMVNQDIPLNAGCLVPLDIVIPEESLLNPSPEAAVCAGNVLTSQRITDVVLRAFQACAASQGCCNNLSFGVGGKDPVTGDIKKGWGYYETIAGGSGAGPDWDGTSGVHCHMTNTRITDPEILERRYPVILRQFGYRPNSGGLGQHNGGDGVVRDLEFLEDIQVSMLSERRARAPYGCKGGEDGALGINTWIKKAVKSRRINLGGKAAVPMLAGDRLVIMTPGGGGWGPVSDRKDKSATALSKGIWQPRGSLAERTAAEASFGA
ncbi:hypothetical protein I302_100009 [Kwoniella bestiolae CBS 10118]|uniref:5-oxoprolinase n=1 Tax=Kwoniella bestiolae CBS 10118 TaxID=1296100 RepID=A0A1B9G3Z1_9TREE|nr:5-oxoprolinase [Kwoniella bestiolae CBS 10118]OCF25708.1 5-oxoprolinase [Kwoniella bestiolae CBS 10118]